MSYGLAVSPRYQTVTLDAGDTIVDLGSPYPFPVIAPGDVKVFRTRAGARGPLTLDVDYAVTMLDQLPGARVTLAAGAMQDDVIEAIGARPVQRPTDLNDGNKFSEALLNAEFDNLTIIAQEQQRDIDRAWKAPLGGDGQELAPDPGKLIGWSADGKLENKTPVDGITMFPSAPSRYIRNNALGIPDVSTAQQSENLDRIANGLLPAPAIAQRGWQLFARGDASRYDLLPGMLNVMPFIPSAHWSAIRDRTITADLTTYLQDAFDVAGETGEFLFFPGGRYSHAGALVYGPQPTSYTPVGNTGTSDLHFMQVPQAYGLGVGFAELFALAAMPAQLTVTFQNGKNAPSMTRMEGLFFNGQNLAQRGLSSQWVFGAEYICNRFDGHTVVNFEHEGRAHLRFAHNILRGQKNVLCRVGGDSNFSGNDFYLRGGAASTRRGIEFGPETGNTVVDKTNVFTLEPTFNVDNTNSVAIYIDGVSTYLGNTGNRDFKIDGCEFHGVETGVFAEGTNNGLLRNIDVVNCHAFQGAQSKVTLAKLTYVNKANIVGNRSNTLGSRSPLPGIILNAVQNVEVAGNHIGGVTGVEAVRIEGNSIDVAVHHNHFLEAVNTAHAYIKVDSSSQITIADNYAQQYTGYTTKFVQEVGAGTGNVYGDNHLSASFTDPYDVANANTTYRGRDFSSATQASVAAGSTVYLGENGTQVAEYQTAWLNPSRPKYAKRLVVQASAAPGAGQTFTYTLHVDGVDTALTAQISGAGTFAAIDIDHEAAIAVGSRFAIKLVTSAGAAVTAHRAGLTLV